MNCFFLKNKSKSDAELPKRRKKKNQVGNNGASKSSTSSPLPSPRSIKELYKENEHNFRIFTLQELVDATHGFNRMLKIGEGGFGKVYRGTIEPHPEDGAVPIVVAIKKLNTRGLQVYIIYILPPCLTSFLLFIFALLVLHI